MLITLTDGALAFGKGTGSARPGGGPQRGRGIGVLPIFSTHFCPNYLHYSAMSAFSAPSLEDTGQAWSPVRGAGPWPLYTTAPGRGDLGAGSRRPGHRHHSRADCAPPGSQVSCLNAKGLGLHPHLSQL